ncbi:hypothetical protein [Streptosporangium pseudovulgare]|uniref:Chaplin domain-containing protein n=1 Tax=Streptosporangium pseudovulgare TaxID=35765 RepID=A0ABQ2QKC1_9ACTN|nr:hypothetical protein [Streptosporangium pseudovulgare]GGP82943.1 hypothetical protein GCM10010140_09730 [Streptosporangium pseudovulgare]
MIGLRNTLAAGTTVLSVIAAPTAASIETAVAGTVAGAVSAGYVFAGSADGAANGGGPRHVGRTLSEAAVVHILDGSADGAANGSSSHGAVNGDSGL